MGEGRAGDLAAPASEGPAPTRRAAARRSLAPAVFEWRLIGGGTCRAGVGCVLDQLGFEGLSPVRLALSAGVAMLLAGIGWLASLRGAVSDILSRARAASPEVARESQGRTWLRCAAFVSVPVAAGLLARVLGLGALDSVGGVLVGLGLPVLGMASEASRWQSRHERTLLRARRVRTPGPDLQPGGMLAFALDPVDFCHRLDEPK